jgi:type IV secretory pathway VirB10-like protein
MSEKTPSSLLPPQKSETTDPLSHAPRRIPILWIGALSAVGIGVLLGIFVFSATPNMEHMTKSSSSESPSGMNTSRQYGRSTDNRVAVAHPTPSFTPQQSSSKDDARVQGDQRIASTAKNNNEAAIMASHPVPPSWASTVPPTSEPIHVAVIYDAQQDNRPMLVTETSVHDPVPPITGPVPSEPHMLAARIDGSREMVMPDVESTPGAVTIPAGSRIAAVLDGSVDSDVQGPVRAHITADVCDPRTGAVAMPRGSWLLGKQGGDVSNGSRHLGILWTRLTYPDLTSRMLIGTDTLDAEGHSGIAGRPNVTGWQTFRDTFVTSLAGAVGQVATQAASSRIGNGATVIVDAPSALNRNSAALARTPSWTVARNTQFLLYLERDFDRETPYRDEHCGSNN